MKITHYFRVFTNRRMRAITFLGFASGFPLALTSGTLQAWLTDAGLNVTTIGWFTIITQPYTWKFLWAPLLDRFTPPFLERRRSWILICQIAMAGTVVLLAGINPQTHLFIFGIVAFFIAFFSATQDIAIDAYRVEITPALERGAASALNVMGYRLAMIVSSAGALILADQYFNWPQTFLLIALFMVGLSLITFFTPAPSTPSHRPQTLEDAVILPLRDFFHRKNAILILIAIIFYKLGEAFALSLSTKFFMDMGFSKTTIAEVHKLFGLIATIAGGFSAAGLLLKLGLFRSLLLFGILQGLANFGFWYLAKLNYPYYWILVCSVGLENFTSGMATTAYIALLMSLCNKNYAASQYALLSALSSVGRVYIGPIAGYAAASFGWANFFLAAVLLHIPSMMLICYLRQSILSYEQESFSSNTR